MEHMVADHVLCMRKTPPKTLQHSAPRVTSSKTVVSCSHQTQLAPGKEDLGLTHKAAAPSDIWMVDRFQS